MINFRYHIVSITAVFLALGIGTALGSTFLDRATVSVLDSSIRSAETRIEATDGENDRLRTQVEAAEARDQALALDAGASVGRGRLADVPVLVLVAPDVETELLDRLRTTLEQADADVRGTLELREGLALRDDVDASLAEAVGLDDADTVDAADVRREVYERLNAALTAAGASDETSSDPGPGPAATTSTDVATTTTTRPGSGTDDDGSSAQATPDGDTPAIVTDLLAADLLRLTPGPGRVAEDPILETTGYRYVFVSPPTSDQADHDVVLRLLPSEPDGPAIGAVVVSSTPEDLDAEPDAEPRPSVVASIRESAQLVALYSTVDNVETFAGLVATVRALETVDTAEAGSWGQGDGATAILPPGP